MIQLGSNAFINPCCHAIRKRRIINLKKRHIQTPPAVLKRRRDRYHHWRLYWARDQFYCQDRTGLQPTFKRVASYTSFLVEWLINIKELPNITKTKIKTEHEELRRNCNEVMTEWNDLIHDPNFKWRHDNWLIERHTAFVFLQYILFFEKVDFMLCRYSDKTPTTRWSEKERCMEILGW